MIATDCRISKGAFDREFVRERMVYMHRNDPDMFPISGSAIPKYFDKLGSCVTGNVDWDANNVPFQGSFQVRLLSKQPFTPGSHFSPTSSPSRLKFRPSLPLWVSHSLTLIYLCSPSSNSLHCYSMRVGVRRNGKDGSSNAGIPQTTRQLTRNRSLSWHSPS
jgi:hypothetical protein